MVFVASAAVRAAFTSVPTFHTRSSRPTSPTSRQPFRARTAFFAPLRPRLTAVTPPRLRASASGASDTAKPLPSQQQQQQQPPDVQPVAKKVNRFKVGLYILLWYAFNIVYNISNKRVLNWFPVPWFVSWVQLLVGVLYVLPIWALRLRRAPTVPKQVLKTMLPISLGHIVGHVSTVVSLGAVAVSFTHVVKSMEPFVNVVGSAFFLNSVFPLPVYLSLLPVVTGVVMASVSEVSFTWLGFLSAMTSNFAFTARNLFSKLSMNKPKGKNMDPANLFAVLSIMSTILLAPVALIIDHPAKLMSAWNTATVGAAAVVTAPKLMLYIFISGLFFYLYQEVAFKALDSVHPITHAVANTVKRVVIIVTSVFVFQNPITKANALGSSVALLGVLLYSVTKNYFPEKKRSA